MHQNATLKIKPACLNEFSAATNAIIIKIKNKIADENILDWDCPRASASPPTSKIYPGGSSALKVSSLSAKYFSV